MSPTIARFGDARGVELPLAWTEKTSAERRSTKKAWPPRKRPIRGERQEVADDL